MSKPLVSVIIPVYNVEPFLAQCLDSVCHQSYENLEIICVNDGSTDRSIDTLNQYSQYDSRLIVIDNENHGVSYSRNTGILNAHGKWVMFVDSDDWLDLDCVEICLSLIQSNEADIVMFPYYSEHLSGGIERKLFNDSMLFEGQSLHKLSRRMIGPLSNEIIEPNKLDSYGTIWGKFYRREIIKDIQFVDLKVIGTAEDSLFCMNAFKKATKVIYTNSIHYHYRKNNNTSVSSKFKPNLTSQWKELYNLIAQNFAAEEEQKALQNRIALNVLGASLNAYHAPKRLKTLKDLLSDSIYQKALAQLDTSFMPIYWRVFFFCAKYRLAWPLLMQLKVIHKIINR